MAFVADGIGAEPGAIAVAMRAALDAAIAHVGATAPNPPVGCAVLDAAGTLLAAAGHRRAGTAHAEAAALAMLAASGRLEAARTLVVTLEPCNHHGRTPPCTEAILASGVREVIVGAVDPDPTVRGGGMERLRAAGLSVHLAAERPGAAAAAFAAASRALLVPFTRQRRDNRPWITVKQAVDRAGSMIPPPGRTTFTSSASLTLAHRLRRATDAVITGAGTIRADRPGFTVRHLPDHPDRAPRLLAVLGRPDSLPPDYAEAAAARGFALRLVPDLAALPAVLRDAGALWAMVEAGPTLLAALRRTGLWDDWLRIEQGVAPADPDILSVTLRDGGSGVSPLSLLPELAVPAHAAMRPTEEVACSPAS